MLPHTGPNVFLEDFKRSFSLYTLMSKFDSSLWICPTPRDHDMNKLESTISEDASTKVTDFRLKGFCEDF